MIAMTMDWKTHALSGKGKTGDLPPYIYAIALKKCMSVGKFCCCTH